MDIQENLFASIKLIVNEVLNKSGFLQSEIATIIDIVLEDNDKNQYIYWIERNNSLYQAISNKKYNKDDQVYILVTTDNQRIILSKVVEDKEEYKPEIKDDMVVAKVINYNSENNLSENITLPEPYLYTRLRLELISKIQFQSNSPNIGKEYGIRIEFKNSSSSVYTKIFSSKEFLGNVYDITGLKTIQSFIFDTSDFHGVVDEIELSIYTEDDWDNSDKYKNEIDFQYKTLEFGYGSNETNIVRCQIYDNEFKQAFLIKIEKNIEGEFIIKEPENLFNEEQYKFAILKRRYYNPLSYIHPNGKDIEIGWIDNDSKIVSFDGNYPFEIVKIKFFYAKDILTENDIISYYKDDFYRETEEFYFKNDNYSTSNFNDYRLYCLDNSFGKHYALDNNKKEAILVGLANNIWKPIASKDILSNIKFPEEKKSMILKAKGQWIDQKTIKQSDNCSYYKVTYQIRSDINNLYKEKDLYSENTFTIKAKDTNSGNNMKDFSQTFEFYEKIKDSDYLLKLIPKLRNKKEVFPVLQDNSGTFKNIQKYNYNISLWTQNLDSWFKKLGLNDSYNTEVLFEVPTQSSPFAYPFNPYYYFWTWNTLSDEKTQITKNLVSGTDDENFNLITIVLTNIAFLKEYSKAEEYKEKLLKSTCLIKQNLDNKKWYLYTKEENAEEEFQGEITCLLNEDKKLLLTKQIGFDSYPIELYFDKLIYSRIAVISDGAEEPQCLELQFDIINNGDFFKNNEHEFILRENNKTYIDLINSQIDQFTIFNSLNLDQTVVQFTIKNDNKIISAFLTSDTNLSTFLKDFNNLYNKDKEDKDKKWTDVVQIDLSSNNRSLKGLRSQSSFEPQEIELNNNVLLRNQDDNGNEIWVIQVTTSNGENKTFRLQTIE